MVLCDFTVLLIKLYALFLLISYETMSECFNLLPYFDALCHIYFCFFTNNSFQNYYIPKQLVVWVLSFTKLCRRSSFTTLQNLGELRGPYLTMLLPFTRTDRILTLDCKSPSHQLTCIASGITNQIKNFTNHRMLSFSVETERNNTRIISQLNEPSQPLLRAQSRSSLTSSRFLFILSLLCARDITGRARGIVKICFSLWCLFWFCIDPMQKYKVKTHLNLLHSLFLYLNFNTPQFATFSNNSLTNYRENVKMKFECVSFTWQKASAQESMHALMRSMWEEYRKLKGRVWEV